MRHRLLSRLGALVACFVAAASLGSAPTSAGDVGRATLTNTGDAATWQGGPFAVTSWPVPGFGRPRCVGVDAVTCERFTVTIGGPAAANRSLDVAIHTAAANTIGVEVYDANLTRVGGEEAAGTAQARILNPAVGHTYSVFVRAVRAPVDGGRYTGTAALSAVTTTPAFSPEPTAECVEAAPAAVGHQLADGLGRIDLDVLVLLDGVDETAAAQAIAGMDATYDEAGIDVQATYRALPGVVSEGTRYDGLAGMTRETVNAEALLDFTRTSIGGFRPFDADIVLTLTSKDLWLGLPGGDDTGYAVLGLADCIGGVRFSRHAFAVGELVEYGFGEGTLTDPDFVRDTTAKTITHEVAHLLGAHHHYSECGPGAVSSSERFEASPCSLMFPDISFVSLDLGSLEGATIRGHAAAYAR